MWCIRTVLFLVILPRYLVQGQKEGQKELHLMCISSSEASCDSAEFAASVVNNMTNILDGYTLRIQSNHVHKDIGEAFKAFVDSVDDSQPTKIGIVGPSFSGQAKVIAEMAKYYNLVQSGFSITSPVLSDTNKYPLFTRTSISSALRNQAIVPILKRYNWSRVATLGKHDEFIRPTMDMFIERNMVEQNMTLVMPAVYHTDPRTQVQQIKTADARIIVVYNWLQNEDLSSVECQVYNEGLYGSKYQWVYWWCSLAQLLSPTERQNDTCTREQRMEALEGAMCIEDATEMSKQVLNYTSDTGMTLEQLEVRYKEWRRYWSATTEGRNDPFSEMSFDSTYSIAKALNKTADSYNLADFTYNNDTIAQRILLELTKLKFIGASGRISYSHVGDRHGTVVINQIRNGSYHQVGSYDPDEGSVLWLADIWFRAGRPPADAPVQMILPIRRDVVLLVIVSFVAFLGVIFSIVCVVFNIYYSEMRIIKLSSPRLNTLIAVGCLLSDVAVILIGLDHSMVNHNILCHLRIVSLSSAFTFAFGAMFVKTWRVHSLFTNRQMTKKIVKDGHLFAVIGVIWIIDLTIVIVWSATDPIGWNRLDLSQVTMNENQITMTPQVVVCDSQHQEIWMGSFYVIKGLMLMFGIFFAWETRKVRVEALNDSKQIGICVYNVMVLSAVCTPLVHLLTENQLNIKFAIIAGSILVCSISTLALVFGPKMYLLATKGNQVAGGPILPFAASLHERSLVMSCQSGGSTPI